MKLGKEKKDILFFDLDGTIVDSGLGITKCVQYSAEKMKLEKPELDKLRAFVGPPLKEMFMEYFHLNESEGEKAVAYYRERYREKGIYENTVYEGIPETFQFFKKKGYKIALATSKPELFAKEILHFFGLDIYFDFIGGSTLGEERNTKTKVIEYNIRKMGIKNKKRIVMIGDRKYDVVGAKEAEISSIGVLYGYGSQEELEQAGADFICKKITDLWKLC